MGGGGGAYEIKGEFEMETLPRVNQGKHHDVLLMTTSCQLSRSSNDEAIGREKKTLPHYKHTQTKRFLPSVQYKPMTSLMYNKKPVRGHEHDITIKQGYVST